MSAGLDGIARYYSFCLTDAQAGRASITRAVWGRLPYRRLGRETLADDRIAGGTAPDNRSNDELPTLTRADVDAWVDSGADWISLVWHPLVFERASAVRHGIQTYQWVPDILAPVSILIYANRDGRILVVGRPRFSRECLEPAAQGSIILGSVDEADRFYDENPFSDRLPPTHDESLGSDEASGPDTSEPGATLAEAADYAQRLFESVCQTDPHQPIPGVQFTRRAYGVVLPARQGIGAIEPLLRTYDAIETLAPDLPCLSKIVEPITNRPSHEAEPIEKRNLKLGRWGTIDASRALSMDQEQAVGAAILLEQGETQAIHGPPGNGKTAILQEIVASRVVESVLRGQAAPQIAIASTNNQALRNALKSFRMHRPDRPRDHIEALLGRRWVEQWPTFGFYNASLSAQAEAQKEGLPILEDMERLERTADTHTLAMTFVQNVRAVTKSGAIGSIAAATDALRALLKAEAKEQVWARTLPATLRKAAKAGQIDKALSSFNEHEQFWRRRGWLTSRDDVSSWQEVRRGLEAVCQSQQALKLAQGERAELLAAIERHWDSDWLLRVLKPARGKKAVRRWAQSRLRDVMENGSDGEAASPDARLRDLNSSLKEHQRTIRLQLNDLVSRERMSEWMASTDRTLHEKARSRWFWIAVHVREGEWIELMNNTLRAGVSDGRSREKMQEQLKRRFLIAPVLVSTLHRLPKILSNWDVQRQAEIPLFEQLDLLIVDEAGQCAPDVAGASLALTKRLIAMGDRAQLEPVWSLELREDLGNRVAADLVTPEDLQGPVSDRITRSGGDTSSGSLLHLSQGSTKYRSEESEHAGVLLTQHRRCLPDIFEFCNGLAYQGRLSSVRADDSVCPLPPVSFLDCPGKERRQYGSRANAFEALMIVHMLAEQEAGLRAAYDKPLNEIVGIVAPFKAQAEEINRALIGVFGKRHGITVGTVHALQGAERPVVIFSLTYNATPIGRTFFFDQSTSMLNVAVSRAQDAFVVVGDLDTLNHAGLPGRALGQHLREYGHRLPWPGLPERADHQDDWNAALGGSIGTGATYKFTESDNAVLKALSEKELGSVIVVCSDIDRGGLQGVGNAMIRAARQGMRVTWLISHEYLLQHKDSQIFSKALETIRSHGVDIRYIGHTFTNLILMPEAGIALWGESSWLMKEPPKRMATTQTDAAVLWQRVSELHGVADEAGDQSGSDRLTA